MSVEKACEKCRMIVTGKECPVCKTSKLSPKWKGLLIVLDSRDSIIAEKAEVKEGKYALKVK